MGSLCLEIVYKYDAFSRGSACFLGLQGCLQLEAASSDMSILHFPARMLSSNALKIPRKLESGQMHHRLHQKLQLAALLNVCVDISVCIIMPC